MPQGKYQEVLVSSPDCSRDERVEMRGGGGETHFSHSGSIISHMAEAAASYTPSPLILPQKLLTPKTQSAFFCAFFIHTKPPLGV